MKRTTAVEALEAIKASVVALAALVPGAGSTGQEDADPLRHQSDCWLDTLAEAARLQAATAALVVHAAAGFADTTRTMASPNALPQGRIAQEMAVVAEIACVLAVSERTAGALLSEAHELTTTLPLTLAALQDGNISWQHARAMVDETASLNPAGAAALEAHFLDPFAPNPASGCPAGELVPSRFRHKARTWRERHHPDSIEKRHTKSTLDRRLEFAPDRDGMAWLSAYLPADQAAGIWDRSTTAARALQGPDEDRTLSQIRADVAAGWLLGGTAEHEPSPSAQVLMTVPVFSLMGLTDEPAMLDGYGPIPASVASRITPTGRQYASKQQDWEPPEWPPQFKNEASHLELGPDVPEDIRSGEPTPENLRPVDPLPEWVWLQWPLDDQDPFPPDGLELCPGAAMPEDPLPAWIRQQAPVDEPWPEWGVPQMV